MRLGRINVGLVLCLGWVVILVGAAMILSPIDSRISPDSAAGAMISVLTVVWLLLTVVALCVYFYRGWKTAVRDANKPYVAWLTFETVFAIALAGGLVWTFLLGGEGDSIAGARERVLRQNLFVLQEVLKEFRLDKHARPHTLVELISAGYLNSIPNDPTTGRNDTWILKCSSDPAAPGIESVESGHGSVAKAAIARCD